MNEGRTGFAQLMDELPQYEFDKGVRRYDGNHHVRSLPTCEQFLVMAFAQLTCRESLRDIETCLLAVGAKLYHSGLRQPAARSTLADANKKRDWRIFSDFAHVLIEQASTLYAILQIVGLTLFEKTPILQALSQKPLPTTMPDNHNQPCLPGLLTGQ